MTPNTVTAQTHWVWTKKAEKSNLAPYRTKAGERVWEARSIEAPAKWLEDGLIQDASEFEKEGQVDLFDILV
ncbi:Fe-S cluster biosynthesis and repair protein YggX [Paenibacillus sp. LBL]|uniref:hypothetical protein n=1 Tax=Paenibacillus sp. LBL TaxID=2940563 RepID=UPI002474EEC3|nr:hypothetical protein [Paenibacillus sp. LBL]MDH6670188.1 Fe-S cluster biosynthesis and repair protein YggX [Paenibacillus sp. LBL]